MRRREDHRKALSEAKFRDIPAWARDNLVLRMLDDLGLKLEVAYDKKYLYGICNKPLIVISSQDQYLYPRKNRSKHVE